MTRALNGMNENELESLLKDMGYPRFRASQLFHFFHKERKIDISNANVLPKDLINKLRNFDVNYAKIETVLESKDGSKKYLLALNDGAMIETVYMPYEDRNTLCVSSQVGCKMGCKFCASTKATFVRSLKAEEILSEIYVVEKDTNRNINNIVIMGIGEPLDNYDEVIRFIKLATSVNGKNMSERNITLSTCGIVPKIYDLANEGLSINLAISLHATSDEKRKKTMPIANSYTINEILKACKFYFDKTGRRVSFEYVLIEGVNDTEGDLNWLIKNIKGKEFHINLIPLNEIVEYDGKSLGSEEIIKFHNKLERAGVHATVRNKRGDDIEGACGQLRIKYGDKMGAKVWR